MNKGTADGTKQEISFTKDLNKKINLNYWKILKLEPNNHWALRVIHKKYGLVNKSKILPKADVFVAKGDVPLKYLEENNYFLDENDIEKFNLKPINHSGISIKRIDSNKYQIIKMSSSTFKKIFDSNILAAGASIYCTKEVDLIKNKAILKGWDISEKEFINYFNKKLNVELLSIVKLSDISNLKKIKQFSNKSIKLLIESDKKISDFIFFGIGNFNEVFIATWLFKQNKLEKNHIIPFSITTGSGRSKGTYTIVVKPL